MDTDAMLDMRDKARESFLSDLMQGRFSDPDARGCDPEELLEPDELEMLHNELERLNIAVIAHIAARDEGMALRLIRSDSWNAQMNSGFEYENDAFRLAAYDWSDDEDADGNPIRRHDFSVKGTGITIDWYKHAWRGLWASEAFEKAFLVAQGAGIGFYLWFPELIEILIGSLFGCDDDMAPRGRAGAWRRFYADMPTGSIEIPGSLLSGEIDSLMFLPEADRIPVEFADRDAVAHSDPGEMIASGVPDGSMDEADMVAERISDAAHGCTDRLACTLSVDAKAPGWLGYVICGGRVFQRMAPR